MKCSVSNIFLFGRFFFVFLGDSFVVVFRDFLQKRDLVKGIGGKGVNDTRLRVGAWAT